MPMMIAKCTECNFTRHVLLIGGNINGDVWESLINHSFKKGHVIKIGDYKYKAIDENHIERCEENKSVESEIPHKANVIREGYTQSGRRKSRYCSVCGHTELQHSVNGLPSRRASVFCRKCNKNCNRVENAKFSYSRPDKSVSDKVKNGGS